MLRTNRERQAWYLLLPMLAIMAVVTGYPLLSTVRLFFTGAILRGHRTDLHLGGWDNFRYGLSDPDFADAFRRTLYFAIASLGIRILLGALVALLLERQ